MKQERKGLKKKNKILGFAFVFGFILLSVVVIFTYFMHVEDSIRETIMTNISELTAHDVKTVESHIMRTWKDLDHISTRLRERDAKTIDELEDLITFERTSSTFSALYLCDRQGNMYTGTMTIEPAQSQDIQQYFADNPDGYFVAWNKDTSQEEEDAKSSLMYGRRLDVPIVVDGIELTGIVGQAKINDIREQLQIESYDGLGNSRIVDPNGNYIVTPAIFVNTYDNIWDAIEDSEHYSFSDQELEQLQERFRNNEDFILEYTDNEQGSMCLIFQPMDITGVSGWYFITQIVESVFADQSRELILMNIYQIVILMITLVLIVMLTVVIRVENAKNQAAITARTDFLNTMSHEIRTPLNGIISLIYQLKIHISNPERTHEYLEKLTRTSEYLLSLVSDILDLSKLQSGKFEIDEQPMSLPVLMDSLQEMEQGIMEAKGIQFQVEYAFMDPEIYGDMTYIKQILMNLLSNAYKFTPADGTVVLFGQQFINRENLLITRFQVHDTGCGISKDFQKSIFDSFSQERSKVQGSIKGTGLGLAISHLLCEQMGGTLSVDSEPGKGSTFTFDLPSTPVPSAQLQPTSQEPTTDPNTDTSANPHPDPSALPFAESDEAGLSIEGLHILVAEDNELNGEILKEILEEAGAMVTLVTDGVQAVDAFKTSEPGWYDVILMDERMPNMMGSEAAVHIRRLHRPDSNSILIFACTADSMQATKEQAQKSGMNDFIPKPVDIDLMLKKIHSSRKSQ